jgi:hypothetical protein
VLEGSAPSARGTWRRIAAIATASLFPTHFLVPALSPVELLTLYAAVACAAAPPTPLHRAKLAFFLAVRTHQPTPDPILLGPLPSLVRGRHSILLFGNRGGEVGVNPKCERS